MTNRHSKFLILFVLGYTLCASSLKAEPQEFVISPSKQQKVTFTSKAPLETVSGTTESISGWIKVNPQDLRDSTTAYFEVQMSTLKTGNKIRDGHMRDNHLHADDFPTSSFILSDIKGLEFYQLEDGVPLKFKGVGIFTCHGVGREKEVDITATWHKDRGQIEVTAFFSVLLSEHEIPRPQFLVMRLDDTQFIEVKFTAHKTK